MINILSKIANAVKKYQKDIFLGLCIILIAIVGFNLGQINAPQKTTTSKANLYQVTVTSSPILNKIKSTPVKPKDPRVVVSKASTSKKYHFTWCPGAKKIKEANKLWFDNDIAAQKAGYTLAANCQ